ncbi:DUF7662 domain-containing protein [Phenylobacterium sp.]|jgi:hypothetical protein|uniref:DUF7662 domain-containing protein n=1 Tax=Phenylobacterium sp. TaxID=1871053 RepID=UPI002F3FE0CC
MSKYNPLSARLAGHAGPEWRASFAELEEVLGFPLPKSARTGKAWWKNDAKAPHAGAWTAGGWEALDVDQAAGLVTFRKIAPVEAAVARAHPAEPTDDTPAILKRLDASPSWGLAIVAGGLALAAGLGALAIGGLLRRRSDDSD